MMKRFFRQVLKLFIPYAIIVLFFFALISYAYLSVIQKIRDNEIEMQNQQIQQSKLSLDSHFEEVFHTIDQIAITPIVKGFSVKDSYDLENHFGPVIQLRETIDNYNVVNSMIHNFFIFYENSGLVVSKQGITNYRYFNNDYYLYLQTEKELFWESMFDRYYYMTIEEPVNYRSEYSFILPVRTSIGLPSTPSKATIYMQLYVNRLRENMTGYGQEFEGNFLIIDHEGKVLISLMDQPEFQESSYIDFDEIGDRWIMTTAGSDVIPYTYVLLQSPEQVFQEINSFKKNALLFLAAAMIGGMIVSALLARYNIKPIIKLMDNNAVLTRRVENQLPYIRSTFLEKWMKGDFVTIEEILSMTKFLKANFIGSHYGVAIIDFQKHLNIFDENDTTALTQTEVKRLVIKDLLTKSLLDEAFIHDLDHKRLAVLFVADCSTSETLEFSMGETMRLCDQILAAEGMENIHYGIGSVYKDMSGVSTSFTEALDAVVFANGSGKGKSCHFSNIEIKQDICYYPPQTESRLYNCVRAGEHDLLLEVLQDLFQKNLVERNLNHQMQQVFIHEMYGTLVKIQQRTFGDNTIINELITNAFATMKPMSDTRQMQYCKQTFIEICDIYGAKREDRHTRLMERIDNFIQDNCHDPAFGLPVIAEEFNISYTYLSEIIKDFKDMSFINYLQSLRMAKAATLLKETDMQVKEIYTQCGYYSGNSFGKAFKRFHGVTASVYRERYHTV